MEKQTTGNFNDAYHSNQIRNINVQPKNRNLDEYRSQDAQTRSKRSESLFDQMVLNTKVIGDSAMTKTQELSRKLEETGIKETLTTRTSIILNKGLELGATLYLKTADKLAEINVGFFYLTS